MVTICDALILNIIISVGMYLVYSCKLGRLEEKQEAHRFSMVSQKIDHHDLALRLSKYKKEITQQILDIEDWVSHFVESSEFKIESEIESLKDAFKTYCKEDSTKN